jgi:hypothetical protein
MHDSGYLALDNLRGHHFSIGVQRDAFCQSWTRALATRKWNCFLVTTRNPISTMASLNNMKEFTSDWSITKQYPLCHHLCDCSSVGYEDRNWSLTSIPRISASYKTCIGVNGTSHWPTWPFLCRRTQVSGAQGLATVERKYTTFEFRQLKHAIWQCACTQIRSRPRVSLSISWRRLGGIHQQFGLIVLQA